MLAFLIAAGVLLLLTLYAVLRPLAARSPRLAVAIAVAVMLASGGLYLHLGTPDALDPALRRAPETLAEARIQLERKLQQAPGDAEGWRLLGRAYGAEGNAANAAHAYAEALKRAPRDPDLLTEAAEARAIADPAHRFDATAVAWLRQALAIDPRHQRARWFLGISLRQAGQPAQAAETWQPLLASVEGNTADTLRAQINQARAEAKLAPLAMPAPDVASARTLPVEVTLSPALAARLAATPQARVFVIARAPSGPPMPVAVRKLAPSQLPATIRLGDADSPMPTAKLSAMQEVEVLARLSLRGDATRGEGDVESAAVRVKLPAQAPIALRIGEP